MKRNMGEMGEREGGRAKREGFTPSQFNAFSPISVFHRVCAVRAQL